MIPTVLLALCAHHSTAPRFEQQSDPPEVEGNRSAGVLMGCVSRDVDFAHPESVQRCPGERRLMGLIPPSFAFGACNRIRPITGLLAADARRHGVANFAVRWCPQTQACIRWDRLLGWLLLVEDAAELIGEFFAADDRDSRANRLKQRSSEMSTCNRTYPKIQLGVHALGCVEDRGHACSDLTVRSTERAAGCHDRFDLGVLTGFTFDRSG